MSTAKIALAQIHPVMGDLEQNTQKISKLIADAEEQNCSLIVFGELPICGYPPEDLLHKKQFVEDIKKHLDSLAQQTKTCTAIIGFIDTDPNHPERLYNAAAICQNGKIQGKYYKQVLPNYAVFDDKRYFTPGNTSPLWKIANMNVGVTICEDIWKLNNGPCQEMSNQGADLLINISASPFHEHKIDERQQVLREQAKKTKTPIVFCNLVGGQDDLVYDGNSTILDAAGNTIAETKLFEEELLLTEVDFSRPSPKKQPFKKQTQETKNQRVWRALTSGLRNYLTDNGFTDICLGLSGGIDSALTTAIATEALGSGHVHPVLMPSRYSSDHSITDSQELCKNLNLTARIIPIEAAHTTLTAMISDVSPEGLHSITEENLQSRIRGLLLMALSNQKNWLVLTTGNKSELAVGYSTLYGDTAGAFAVIKDLWKTRVYELCSWYNQQNPEKLIPTNILEKPASAELRPDQRDDQSLPPYNILDPILIAYVENNLTAKEITQKGNEAKIVNKVTKLVDNAEFKRRQSPLGTRVTKKAFGRDRRIPITNTYSE